MADDEEQEPRVLVVMPDGHVVNGILRSRRRDPEGNWWYQTTVDLPADRVQPVAGQHYDRVPTVILDTYPWQLEAPAEPGATTGVLHRGDCEAPRGRLTPMSDPVQARVFLREGWATACEVCRPEP